MNQKEQYAARSTQNVAVSTESVYPCTTGTRKPSDAVNTNTVSQIVGAPESVAFGAPQINPLVKERLDLISKAENSEQLARLAWDFSNPEFDAADRIYLISAYYNRLNELNGRNI